jgi:hypothetical protein
MVRFQCTDGRCRYDRPLLQAAAGAPSLLALSIFRRFLTPYLSRKLIRPWQRGLIH